MGRFAFGSMLLKPLYFYIQPPLPASPKNRARQLQLHENLNAAIISGTEKPMVLNCLIIHKVFSAKNKKTGTGAGYVFLKGVFILLLSCCFLRYFSAGTSINHFAPPVDSLSLYSYCRLLPGILLSDW